MALGIGGRQADGFLEMVLNQLEMLGLPGGHGKSEVVSGLMGLQMHGFDVAREGLSESVLAIKGIAKIGFTLGTSLQVKRGRNACGRVR
jgi:hypothetical protein